MAPERRLTILPPGCDQAHGSEPMETVLAVEDVAAIRVLHPGGLTDNELRLVTTYLSPCFAPIWAEQLGRAVSFGHLAQSLDGKIATGSGDSKWIGGPGNLVHAHRMRALCDAVLVGSQTLKADQPRLNVRHVTGPDPVRVVLGRSLDVQCLLDGATSPVLVVGSLASAAAGAELVTIERDVAGAYTVQAVLAALFRRGLTSVYVEGGAYTLNRFIEDGALDVLQVHIAPLIVGDGTPAFPRASVARIADAQRLGVVGYVGVDDGVMLVARCQAPGDGSLEPVTARALWHEAIGRSGIHTERLRPLPSGWCRVETQFSAVSPGTEGLVATGGVPEALRQRMACAYMGGDFAFPVKYGYSLVGRVVAGPDHLLGQAVHVFHPHQDQVQVRCADLHPIPADVPLPRATLAANLETALNAVWDAQISLGQRVLVVGFGTVGSLIARVLTRMAGVMTVVVDVDPGKCELAETLGFQVQRDGVATDSFDVVFHTSASAAGLQLALDSVGFEGTVVDLSWYGDRPVTVGLGGSFHTHRKRLVSSQVGTVAQPMREQWTYARRMQLVMAMLADPVFDGHITRSVDFSALPGVFAANGGRPEASLSILVRY